MVGHGGPKIEIIVSAHLIRSAHGVWFSNGKESRVKRSVQIIIDFTECSGRGFEGVVIKLSFGAVFPGNLFHQMIEKISSCYWAGIGASAFFDGSVPLIGHQ